MVEAGRSRGAQALGVLVLAALVLWLALDEDAGVRAVQAFLRGVIRAVF